MDRITNRADWDTAQAQAGSDKLVVIMVFSESSPICRAVLPKVESLATKYAEWVNFYKMELDSNTAPMIKLGVQNTPSFCLMKGAWGATIIGPNLDALEKLVAEKL